MKKKFFEKYFSLSLASTSERKDRMKERKRKTKPNYTLEGFKCETSNPLKSTLDFSPPWKHQSIHPSDWPPMNFR